MIFTSHVKTYDKNKPECIILYHKDFFEVNATTRKQNDPFFKSYDFKKLFIRYVYNLSLRPRENGRDAFRIVCHCFKGVLRG